MTVRVYVDWSGDPGFRFRRGSSEFLLIAAVMSDEEISIASLREKLFLPEDFEFHFSKVDNKIREQFCSYLNSEIEIPGAVVLRIHKERLPEHLRKRTGEQLLADFIALGIANLPHELLQNAFVIYDGKKEQKSFRNVLRKALSESLKPEVFLREVKAVAASQNDGLQIADMLAGLIRTVPEWVHLKNLNILEHPPLK